MKKIAEKKKMGSVMVNVKLKTQGLSKTKEECGVKKE